jgi:YaiO family outer membrane protein
VKPLAAPRANPAGASATDRNPMVQAVSRCVAAALTAACLGSPPPSLSAQGLSIAAWGSYDGVTSSEDWSTAGAQLRLSTAAGNAAWVAGERLGRFDQTDATQRLGVTLHPGPRWWIAVEAGTARRPAFMPKNSWEADLAALLARQISLGLTYRRWNYVVGPVDFLVPHLTLDVRPVAWDLRVSLSRNPSQRTDAAFIIRATAPLAPRATLWMLGAAGRESFLVGTAPAAQVRSLETVTGAAGLRYDAGSGFRLSIDATVVRSRPVLSRRGVRIEIERRF